MHPDDGGFTRPYRGIKRPCWRSTMETRQTEMVFSASADRIEQLPRLPEDGSWAVAGRRFCDSLKRLAERV